MDAVTNLGISSPPVLQHLPPSKTRTTLKPKIKIFKWGSVKCRMQTDIADYCFLGLENTGTIVLTFSFAW